MTTSRTADSSLGFDFLHVAVDDHSRYACIEALADERGVTAAAFLVRALAHFERQGITAECILTDNGACYVSRIFTDTAAARNIRLKRMRPFRPQTNGKAEAFNNILQAEWAYLRPYYSNRERLDTLSRFLAYYNHGVHTAASAGLLPPPACQQRPWELHLGRRRYGFLYRQPSGPKIRVAGPPERT